MGVGETGGKETRVKVMGVREIRWKVSGGKATGEQVSQETGGNVTVCWVRRRLITQGWHVTK